MRCIRLAALLAGAVALTAACTDAPAPSPTPTSRSAQTQSAPTQSATAQARKLTPAELQGQWWSWAASTEQSRNPVLDEDGHLCARGQKDGIWFLAGTTGGTVSRSCTVPVGAPIAFPLVNIFGQTSDCTDFMKAAKGSAALDGSPLTPETFDATPIEMAAVPGNPFTSETSAHTWSCGLWVRLDPLTPGTHELTLRGESGSFSTGVDYHLTVAERPPAGTT
ncbi:signal protein [Streptomyces sp. NRRL WC-3742]|uniref:signal protein n=1 Tax=Streptomyces sp. NRRL WC-3742 TaxID=1463934 RepID=UPI000A7C2D09|nr:signal protein [Streptomyces sp. NRRL WC-3742]